MNKTMTIALASLLAVSPVASIAYAQDATTTQEGTTGMTSDTMPTGAISADSVSVVQISSLEADDSERGEAKRLTLKGNDAAEMQKVQAELQSDAGLVEVLAAKNVQLENVIEIQTSATGGKVVYVK